MQQYQHFLPLLGAFVLAACGGGGHSDNPPDHTMPAGSGIAVGEPSPGVVAKEAFVKLARESDCADRSNRLYIVDGKQVFWERSGNCPDNSYSYSLWGATPATQLCATGDSIAGPQTHCSDESQRAVLTTITANLGREDLGLGAGHTVELLPFLPKDGPVAFDKLPSDDYTAIKAAQNVVVRDAGAWAKLWATAYQNRTPAPEPLKIDFSRKMVLAVFTGEQPTGCRSVAITGVSSAGGKLRVEYKVDTLQTVAICTQATTSPVAMAMVDRNTAEVEFIAK